MRRNLQFYRGKFLSITGILTFGMCLLFGSIANGQVVEVVSAEYFTKPIQNEKGSDNRLIWYAPVDVDDRNREALNTIISLDLTEVTMEEALLSIVGEVDLRMSYSVDATITDWNKPVSLQLKEATVLGALYAVLDGTDLRLKITPKGLLILHEDHQPVVDEHIFNIEEDEQQQETVRGTVTDAQTGEALPGVNIILQGTTTGTTTDSNGSYELTVPSLNETLVYSYIGYQTQEVTINGRNELEVALQSEVISGEELVVVGYGQQVRKSDLTGSVASVSGEEMRKIPNSNLMQALKGRSAGVHVKQNHGHPGGNISIRIRGANSLQGSNEPLYVVDGFPVEDPEIINNSNIESVEILKDASATAIYGSRASNGVVIITTNRGREGRTQVNFESSYGTQWLIKEMEMMNPLEYGEYYNVVHQNMIGFDRFSQTELNDFATMGNGTNWQEVVFQKAPIANNSLEINAGNERTSFNITGSAFNQEGIIENSDYNRYSLSSKIQHDISSRFSVEASLSLSRYDSRRQISEQGRYGTSLIGRAYGIPNYIPVYNEDGSYAEAYSINNNFSAGLLNPLNHLEQRKRQQIKKFILSNVKLSYELFDGLLLNILGGIESTDTRNEFYQTKNFQDNPEGSASLNMREHMSRLIENTLTYNSSFGDKHEISALVGITYQDFSTLGFNASASDFFNDVSELYDFGSANRHSIPNTSLTESVMISGLSRVNYIFDDRYLFTVSFRSDGSSRYSEGNKWAYFPALALAWRLSNEEFINLDGSVLDDIKLRASWGTAGSQAIAPYSTLNNLNSSFTIFGTSTITTMLPSSNLASDLKWETTETVDLGLELSFLNGRIQFEADYYNKITSDLLNSVELARSTGYVNSLRNVGEIRNRGFEFSVNSSPLLTQDFIWNLDANISFNRSEVLKLYTGEDILAGRLNMRIFDEFAIQYREGEPRGVFYGYKEDGYDANGGFQYTTDMGNKVKIGDPNPNFIFGINSGLSYKDLTLSLSIYGTQGNDIINMSALTYTIENSFEPNKIKDVVNNYWTPNNQDAKYPQPRGETGHDYRFSDRFVEDGSFLRLQNIELSYNLAQKLSGVRNAEVYISGQNLLTLTNYSWVDPDVNTRGGSNSLQQGIDYNTYPSAKSIIAGIRLGF